MLRHDSMASMQYLHQNMRGLAEMQGCIGPPVSDKGVATNKDLHPEGNNESQLLIGTRHAARLAKPYSTWLDLA